MTSAALARTKRRYCRRVSRLSNSVTQPRQKKARIKVLGARNNKRPRPLPCWPRP